MTEPTIISRAEAKRLGLPRYCTGRPCRCGHIAERYVADKHCVPCRHDNNKRRHRSRAPERPGPFLPGTTMPYTIMGECWISALKPKSRGGYCSIKIGSCSGGRRPKTFRLHRYVYEQVKGPIPAGLIVRHACNNPACSNPAHLDVGTHFDDTTDKFNRGKGPQKVNLIELRNLKAQGLSQLKIAKVLGLSPSTVGQYFAPRGRYRDRLERGP